MTDNKKLIIESSCTQVEFYVREMRIYRWRCAWACVIWWPTHAFGFFSCKGAKEKEASSSLYWFFGSLLPFFLSFFLDDLRHIFALNSAGPDWYCAAVFPCNNLLGIQWIHIISKFMRKLEDLRKSTANLYKHRRKQIPDSMSYGSHSFHCIVRWLGLCFFSALHKIRLLFSSSSLFLWTDEGPGGNKETG